VAVRTARLILALVTLIAPATAASAQDADPVAEAPLRVGILGVAPRLTISNLGVDTNVFNDVDDPQQDFTAVISPGADAWMRLGRGLVTFGSQLDLTYFHDYTSERSVGGMGSVRYEYRANRLRPFVSYAIANTRQRPGYEIDVRARQVRETVRAGLIVRVGPMTDFETSVRRQTIEFAGDAVFGGRALNEALNRTLEAVDASWRQRLTVLTTWVVRASGERERFDLSPERNSDSVHVSTGFELGRFALIRGSAFVGYREMTPAAGGTLPGFSGVTANVGLSYSAPTRTRLQLDSARDVEYSFEFLEPYYVQTGVRGTLTQVVTGNWDIQVHGGQDQLSYRSSLTPGERSRLDRIDRFGGGIGYQVNPEFRLGINVESFYRRSERPERTYRGLRAGAIVNYGF
jgi:hypothetical protein